MRTASPSSAAPVFDNEAGAASCTTSGIPTVSSAFAHLCGRVAVSSISLSPFASAAAATAAGAASSWLVSDTSGGARPVAVGGTGGVAGGSRPAPGSPGAASTVPIASSGGANDLAQLTPQTGVLAGCAQVEVLAQRQLAEQVLAESAAIEEERARLAAQSAHTSSGGAAGANVSDQSLPEAPLPLPPSFRLLPLCPMTYAKPFPPLPLWLLGLV